MNNRLQFWIDARAFHRHMLGIWNRRKQREYASESLQNVAWTTRCLADEIRRVEKQLGRPYRYLPQSGIYQGIKQ
jgi:hypothetical protein